MRKFVVPVAKIWRELGLKVGSAFKDDLHPGGRDGGHGGPVNSRFQRYCHAALSAFGMTDRISADLVRAIKKLSASQ
jgi:hypothetical protein